MFLLAAVLTAWCWWTAATAHAQTVRYTNQRAAHEPELHAMLAVADKFWNDRGVTSPCDHTELDVADDVSTLEAPHTIGHGYSPLFGAPDYRIVLDGDHFGRALAVLRDESWPDRDRRAVSLSRVELELRIDG